MLSSPCCVRIFKAWSVDMGNTGLRDASWYVRTRALQSVATSARFWTSSCHGNSTIVRGSVSAGATAKLSMAIWFHRLPPEYYLTATEMRLIKIPFLIFWWKHYMIYAHHTWSSQMHDNLLISCVKLLNIARVLTRLINKFSCIRDGQTWWVRVIMHFGIGIANIDWYIADVFTTTVLCRLFCVIKGLPR